MEEDSLGSGPRAFGGEGPQEVALRVAQWRVAHGVRLDEDFAFAFCSLEEATRDAGPDVAAAWQRARARSADEDSLALITAPSSQAIQAGAIARKGPPAGSSGPASGRHYTGHD